LFLASLLYLLTARPTIPKYRLVHIERSMHCANAVLSIQTSFY